MPQHDLIDRMSIVRLRHPRTQIHRFLSSWRTSEAGPQKNALAMPRIRGRECRGTMIEDYGVWLNGCIDRYPCLRQGGQVLCRAKTHVVQDVCKTASRCCCIWLWAGQKWRSKHFDGKIGKY